MKRLSFLCLILPLFIFFSNCEKTNKTDESLKLGESKYLGKHIGTEIINESSYQCSKIFITFINTYNEIENISFYIFDKNNCNHSAYEQHRVIIKSEIQKNDKLFYTQVQKKEDTEITQHIFSNYPLTDK